MSDNIYDSMKNKELTPSPKFVFIGLVWDNSSFEPAFVAGSLSHEIIKDALREKVIVEIDQPNIMLSFERTKTRIDGVTIRRKAILMNENRIALQTNLSVYIYVIELSHPDKQPVWPNFRRWIKENQYGKEEND